MIKINLLPVKAAKKKERIMTQLYVGVLVLLLALAALGYSYYSQKTKIQMVEEEITRTDQKIQKLLEAKKKFEELKKKKEILEKQLEAIEQLDRGRDWFIRILDKITESTPRNQVWLESVSFGKAGRGGKAQSGNSLSIKGLAYDRDSIAHFMGNMSIIPCDDAMPEEEKAVICRERNEKCRTWNDTTKNWEWDFEACRRFYRDTCSQSKSCAEDVSLCKASQSQICRDDPKGKACNDAKEKCQGTEAKCRELAESCKKLHQEEYIVYNDVQLLFVKAAKVTKGQPSVYSFELAIQATEPPKE